MKYNAKYDRWVSKDGLVYRYDKKNDKLVLCAERVVPNKGYIDIFLSKPKRTPYRLHRLVWETFNGEIPQGYEIDHIDCNKQNNALSNLRCVTHSENMLNPLTRIKNSASQKGKKLSKEHRDSLSKSMRKPRSDFGKKFLEKYGYTKSGGDLSFYNRERYYYNTHNKVCSWEVEEPCKS